MNMEKVCFFIFLFALSCVLTYAVKKYALKKSILDIPNERSSHKIPVPRGGGLAFVFTFYIAVLFLFLSKSIPTALFLALLGGIPVALIGYIDDIKSVKSTIRISVHIFAAIWGIACLGWVHFLYFGVAQLSNLWLCSFIAIFFIVWFINLFNFMDGIDGIAASETIFIALSSGILLLNSGYASVSHVCFVLAAVVGGFLVWNWPSAKIFMGDIGSGFLGYVLAILMWSTNNSEQLPTPIWWILSVVFIGDASFTLIKRMWQGKQWYSAHREHAYQHLVQSGFSHTQVTIGVLLVNIFICLPLALLYFKLQTTTLEIAYLAAIILLAWTAWVLSQKLIRKICVQN